MEEQWEAAATRRTHRSVVEQDVTACHVAVEYVLLQVLDEGALQEGRQDTGETHRPSPPPGGTQLELAGSAGFGAALPSEQPSENPSARLHAPSAQPIRDPIRDILTSQRGATLTEMGEKAHGPAAGVS